MLRVGLTGGIASGKSTVAAMLRDARIPRAEADALAHDMIEPGQAGLRRHRAGIWTRRVCAGWPRMDRKKLGAVVFADAEKLARLNAHRASAGSATQFTASLPSLERDGLDRHARLSRRRCWSRRDIAEAGRLVVAWCKPEQQVERLLARGLRLEAGAAAHRGADAAWKKSVEWPTKRLIVRGRSRKRNGR